jgi:myo-inositol-1(or 4)-monophosphatase
MTDQDLADRLAFARTLIADAGGLALGYFNDIASLTITTKGPQDLASEADLQTELLIRDRLKARFPADAFFGEETGPTGIEGADGIWVVDPIDGTQPFLAGLPNWCVSIAFVAGGVCELGLVFGPATGELFVARRGHGATLNGRPIHAHPGRSVRDGIVSVGYNMKVGAAGLLPVMRRLLESGGMFHRNGSGAISLCYVAAGRLLGYVEPFINSWDCLAGLLLITEAGGRTNDFLANDGLATGNPIVAGGPNVFGDLVEILG